MNRRRERDDFATKEAITDFVHKMPKAEIHIHLEGSIQPETLLTLAGRHNALSNLPAADPEQLRRWFTFTDFSHFIEIYFVICDLLRTPEDFETIVYACGQEMAAQHIRYRELTLNTPYLHTHLQEKGLLFADIRVGLEEGRRRAKEDFGVEMRWVLDIPRNACFPRAYHSRFGEHYNSQPTEVTLEYALDSLGQGVVGFGLGGNEVGAPPAPYASAFDDAKRAGLLSVPHAGETMGAASVRGALHDLQADRIGHGVRAIEDPFLLAELRERRIPLEISPTSNVRLHVYNSLAAHPFPHLDRMGLFVTVNSDDPPLFNTTLVQEYLILATRFDYDKADIARIARNAFVACGADEGLKREMLEEFDRWVRGEIGDGNGRKSRKD